MTSPKHLPALALLLVFWGCSPPVRPPLAAAEQAVEQAVLDYVEGVYTGDSERIRRSVHPELVKLGLINRPDGTQVDSMTRDRLLQITPGYPSKYGTSARTHREITVFDIGSLTASARVVASWGTDYLHLAKYEDRWLIIHVLWQN